ncbi:protocadherin Fat 4-like isoform X2 [Mya arenaria]|uniref:protocadherin Fat 4-like isoform X2 n=1 Tax=Mya arenaria TaxID=6604 RepID=UPI0022E3ED59|nr:protocadherin Fat 4-like isoform X2 [Mya arenaria]
MDWKICFMLCLVGIITLPNDTDSAGFSNVDSVSIHENLDRAETMVTLSPTCYSWTTCRVLDNDCCTRDSGCQSCYKNENCDHEYRTCSSCSKTFGDAMFVVNGGDSINVFQNSSGEGSVIATLNVNYIENSQDEDRLTYRLESGPGPAWITGHTLFAMNPSNGHISVRKSLADEFSYDAFNMTVCIKDRRHPDYCRTLHITLWACFQTPNCTDQNIPELWDTHGIAGHSDNTSLFQMIYPEPTYHFPNFRNTWSKLTWTLDNGGFVEADIDSDTGDIYLTRNISIWPAWPSKHYTMTVTVANSESCYTTTCQMDVEVFYTNWPPTICSINGTGSHTSLHEDTDSETLLHELQVCDYNYDRPSDLLEVGKVNGIEDNSTCWIEHVYDQWGENDMELFTLREDDPSYTNKWDSYRLYKKECIVPSSPYKPPCGYKRENYTCPKHMGCMTHNVTQSYSVSIICRDGYGESDNRNFTFNVNSNQAPTYLNLPNEIIVDMNAASEHDIIFSTLYRDAENENLTYEYSFTKADDLSSVGYFKADPSGNYFDSLGNITLTQFLKYEPKNSTYLIHICGHERRNEICEYLTVHFHDNCGPSPSCTSHTFPTNTELTPGTQLFDVSSLVTDPSSFTSLQYSLTAKNMDLFQIDATSGAITTTQTLPASYPSTTYSLNAFVTDKLSCTAYAVCPLTLVVNYINYDLTITNLPDSVNIHEDEKTELTLFTVQTTDNNTDDSVTCLITNEEDNKPFFIEETYSGSDVWVVKNYVAGTNEERQLSAIKQTYTLNIDCHDTFGAGESKNLTITVTPNEGPTLTTLNTGVVIDQSVVFSGAVLLTETATDPERDTLNYTCTVSDTNNPLTCAIDGSLVEIKLRRNVSIVTENGRSDSIEVCVGDAKHPNHYCAHLNVTFNTTHTHPTITNLPFIQDVNENAAVGLTLFTLTIGDVDVPLETHTIQWSVSPATATSYFNVEVQSDGDTSTGVVTLLRSLDFESLSKYTLTFTVNDGYLSSLQSYILVLNVTNVNEGNTITATKTSITFKETAKVGRIFDFGLQCLDEDHEEALTFSIIGGNHMDYFVLNTTNRKIYLAKEWDLEGSDNLPSTDSLTVQCEDAGGLSSTVELTFNIVDVNEHPPSVACTLPNGNTCPSTLSEMKFELKSDSSITDSLLTVTCAEPDGCNFDCVGNGLCKKYFRLVPKTTRKRSTGASSADLKLKQELDFNYNKEFVITIKISDLNDPPKFTGVSLLINYTATPPSPTPAVTSNCVTCSSQGRVLVGVLTVECIIAGLLVLHLVYHFGIRPRFRSQKTLVSPANIRRRALSNNGAKNATLNQRSSQIKAETTFSQRMERKTAYESSSSDSDSDSSSGTEVMAARPSPGRDNSRNNPVPFRPVYSSSVPSNRRFNGNETSARLQSSTGLPPPVYSTARLPGQLEM